MKSGRPHSFDPDVGPLEDVPLREEMTQRQRVATLARLRRIEKALHRLAADAYSLGLAASWLRLEAVDDDIDDAIVAVQAEIGGDR